MCLACAEAGTAGNFGSLGVVDEAVVGPVLVSTKGVVIPDGAVHINPNCPVSQRFYVWGFKVCKGVSLRTELGGIHMDCSYRTRKQHDRRTSVRFRIPSEIWSVSAWSHSLHFIDSDKIKRWRSSNVLRAHGNTQRPVFNHVQSKITASSYSDPWPIQIQCVTHYAQLLKGSSGIGENGHDRNDFERSFPPWRVWIPALFGFIVAWRGWQGLGNNRRLFWGICFFLFQK